MTDCEFDEAVSGVRNFRDAGAGLLRPGLFYRSGSLNELTPEGAQQLKKLGIRTVIDLRAPGELQVWPDELHGLDCSAVHLPVFPDRDEDETRPETLDALYPYMAEVGGQALAGVFRHLAAAEGAVLIHCAVGKDRTGLASAVVQSVAGLAKTDVLTDYLRSNARLGLEHGPTLYLDEDGTEQVSNPVTPALLAAALGRIKQLHGSLPGYLRAHGVTDTELDAVRTALRP